MNHESMVYLNKVFTDIDVQSCPLLSQLATTADTFEQQLSLFTNSDETCCCNIAFDPADELNFVVDSTQVFITDFSLVDPTTLLPADVTVNGIPVDTLDFFNERYMASTNDLMARVADCSCMERGASTNAMLLIRNAGNWEAKLTIVLRGSVFGCSGCKRFKLVMTTREGVTVDIPGISTFSVASICLPCTTGGIAPIINFSFDAKSTMLNPQITTGEGGGTCNLIVTGSLITEPIAEIQVTRQTLFSIDAMIINQPCDELRRCNQASGNCNPDDDCDAVQLRNRCCSDGPCEPKEPERPRNCSCNRPSRQITCQWNGCNGCGF